MLLVNISRQVRLPIGEGPKGIDLALIRGSEARGPPEV